MDNVPHSKIFDFLDHLWPYLTGLTALLIGSVRLWWSDKKATKQEISDLRKVVLWLKENAITDDQLHACREEVRDVDEKNLAVLFTEIKALTKENRQEHRSIMKENEEKFERVMDQIIKLHTKRG